MAVGILSHAQKVYGIDTVEGDWFERLGQWDDALAVYERQATSRSGPRSSGDNGDSWNALGRMRCLNATGRWEKLSALAKVEWLGADEATRSNIAPLAASAAAGQGAWADIATYLPALDRSSLDHSWYSALLAVHLGQRKTAKMHIAVSREQLERELATLMGESYTRAYQCVCAQC